MRVVACIVGFRNADDVTRCIAALDRTAHRPLDVVICENGGTAAFQELQRRLPGQLHGTGDVRIIDAGGNLGYGGGFNACLAAAPDADAWWLVNPDAEPAPDALEKLLARLARGDVGAVGGTLCLPDGRVQGHGGRWRHWLARAESIGHGDDRALAPDPDMVERRMNYILGASMLVDRAFLKATGPMREDYFLYAEEIEWCLRAQARGQKLGFAPGAWIGHAQGSTTGSAQSVAARPWLPIYLDERNKLNVVRDTGIWRLPAAAAASFLLILLRYARRGAWRQTGDALAGWWAGLLGRRGIPKRLG